MVHFSLYTSLTHNLHVPSLSLLPLSFFFSPSLFLFLPPFSYSLPTLASFLSHLPCLPQNRGTDVRVNAHLMSDLL